MVTDNHYRWDFIGLSTDTKPTPSTSPKVVNGSTYYCSDNSKLYIWYKDQWYERKPLGGGGGGGGSYTAGSGIDITDDTISVDTTVIQPLLTAGSNITISDNTISATNTTYTAGSNVSISDQNVISATDTTYSNFTGTDGTAAGVAGLVPAPATTDAGKFLKADGTWDTAGGGSSYTAGDGIDITNSVISATNTGKAKVLTTDDYNWPTTGTKTSVALWLLNPGLYTWSSGVTVNVNSSQTNTHGTVIVGEPDPSNNYNMTLTLFPSSQSIDERVVSSTTGAQVSRRLYLYSDLVKDNLTSTSTDTPLSANQGKVLKDLIDSLAFKNAGAPTTSTVGTVGQLLEDTTNGKLYICTDTTGGSYTWTEVGAGGSGPTVVQTTGTSTTDVMSQNAVTNLIFNNTNSLSPQIGPNAYASSGSQVALGTGSNASGDYAISIGNIASTTGSRSLAIGNSASASTANSIAIGSNATTTVAGEVNIGAGTSGRGYNSTNYRLLSGVYDGQNAHDAATKGQLDSIAIQNSGAPTTSTVGTVGQLLEDTTNGKLYICTDTTGGSYTWVEVGAGGGSGPTVVQTTGTSTTDVMSQNAVTSMVFADPATQYKIKIGSGASGNEGAEGVEIGHNAGATATGNVAVGYSSTASGSYGAVAIGNSATASGSRAVAVGPTAYADSSYCVALGKGARATVQGQFDVSTGTDTTSGYNNSNYRLLTGLYDPQSAHDAATKGYVDPTTDSSAPTTATVGRLGQIFIDTTNADAYMCVAVDSVTPSYTWKKINA